LSGCSEKVKDAPPLASEVDPSDPEAEALFASAKSADGAGDTKKAIKLYEEVAVKHSYSEIAPQARF
ncbi:MAG: hypothetical protein GWO24_10750, partial [Akkermansiaceae bacterium]|nr:hypothetical protein [Akkermansiaceae bacterium]